MYKIQSFCIVLVIPFVLTGFWMTMVQAGDIPARKVPIEAKKKPAPFQIQQNKARKVEKKHADVGINYVEVWPSCSAGPGISVALRNKGPHTAYDIKVTAAPGRHGLTQHATVDELWVGGQRSPGLLVEGGNPITVKIKEGSKYHDPNDRNNTCVVDTEIPVPCGACPNRRCKPFKFYCHQMKQKNIFSKPPQVPE